MKILRVCVLFLLASSWYRVPLYAGGGCRAVPQRPATAPRCYSRPAAIRRSNPGPRVAPPRSQPKAVPIVCTQDRQGRWWVRAVMPSSEAAQELSRRLNGQGTRAWAMKAVKVEDIPQLRGKSISLSNDEIAIAIAISFGDDTHAVAIGPSGRAEALAKR